VLSLSLKRSLASDCLLLLDMTSKAHNYEELLKKRLQSFLQDLQRWGTVGGFKHFTCCVRGKEELVVSINNSIDGNRSSRPVSRKQSLCISDSFSSAQLPYDKRSLVLSHNSQMGLSGLGDRGVGLPPASPSEQESLCNTDSTLFLIAGYARYSCPYVWVRSNHDRLLKTVGEVDTDRDSPLRLKSTSKWKDGDINMQDILAELVKLTTYPAPQDPFELDLDYFHGLDTVSALLASAAMLTCLQKVVVSTEDTKPYVGRVSESFHHMSQLHFSFLKQISKTENLPIYKDLAAKNQARKQHFKQSITQRPLDRQYYSAQPTTFFSPMSIHSTQPTNSGVTYGQGPQGAFPGGFERTPAPSLF